MFREAAMREVKVRKDELIGKIKDNMETHQSTYDTAVEEFTAQQTALLEEMLEKARTGKNFDRLALSRMPVPENHIDDYRRALAQLEMEVDDEIVLQQHEFNQLVLDEWEWSRNFTANTIGYAAAAGAR
jgi:hypothetical protein